eukprot:SAG11_NODE_9180_length_935_cov_0.799043_2_plen_65_part_00
MFCAIFWAFPPRLKQTLPILTSQATVTRRWQVRRALGPVLLGRRPGSEKTKMKSDDALTSQRNA